MKSKQQKREEALARLEKATFHNSKLCRKKGADMHHEWQGNAEQHIAYLRTIISRGR